MTWEPEQPADSDDGVPNSYLTSPYLSLDNQAIANYVDSEQHNPLDDVITDLETDLPQGTDLSEIPRKVYTVHNVIYMYMCTFRSAWAFLPTRFLNAESGFFQPRLDCSGSEVILNETFFCLESLSFLCSCGRRRS